MTRLPLASLVLLGVLLAFAPPMANAANVGSHFYKQVNSANGVAVPHERMEAYDPLNAPVSVTEQPPLGRYTFDLEGTPLDQQRTAISARTSLSASLDVTQPGATETWESAEAGAETRASLLDFASVEGASGLATVRFNWTVTGTSRILLDTSDFRDVDVTELSTQTILQSTIEGAGSVILDEFQHYPNTNSFDEVFDMSYPAATGGLVFDVQWPADTEMAVSFDLVTRTKLYVTAGLEKTGLDAVLDAEFFNTADLVGVQIVQDGQIIPGARLVSGDGFSYPVPEPSGLLLLLIGVLGFILRFRGHTGPA